MIEPILIEIIPQLGVYGVAIIAILGAIWAAGKAIVWLAKTFFPGLVAVAQGVVQGAKIYGAVQGLPEYIERNDHQMAVMGEQLREVHHETQLNSGKSLKDHAVRTDLRLVRIEKHLGIPDEKEGVAVHPAS